MELSDEVVTFIDTLPALYKTDGSPIDMEMLRNHLRKQLAIPTMELTLYVIAGNDGIKEWHLSGGSSLDRNYGFCTKEEMKEIKRQQREGKIP